MKRLRPRLGRSSGDPWPSITRDPETGAGLVQVDPRIVYFYRTFYRVPFLVPFWTQQDSVALIRGLRTAGRGRQGDAVFRLEQALAVRLGFVHVVLTSTGRFALEVALRSLGRRGGEVIVPTFGCRTVAQAVVEAGLVPIFADINEDLTISAESVEANLTDRTVAVIMAHLSGKPAADLDEIVHLCDRRGVVLIDDAAQATGVRHGDRVLGSFGEFGVLSFGLGKPTFSLGGGALVVRSAMARKACEEIVDEVGEPLPSRSGEVCDSVNFLLQYRWRRGTLPLFMAGRVISRMLGFRPGRPRKGRMTEMEATLQMAQFEKLDRILGGFRANGRRVVAALASSGSPLVAPQASEDCAYTKCIVRAPQGAAGQLATHLLRRGIEIEWSYRPLNLSPDFGQFRRNGCSRAEAVWADLLAVPVHPGLPSEAVEHVASALAGFEVR